MSTRTEYAFDFGDELDDFTINGGQRDDAEALRRYRELTGSRQTAEEVDLYKHALMMRTVTFTETEWTPVPEVHHDAADLISVEPS